MGFTDLAKRAEKLLADNSPVILTGIGVAGTLTTVFLTGKASFAASLDIRAEQLRIDVGPDVDIHTLETKEKVELVWKLYIPPAITGVLTIAAIIFANRVGSRRAAALAAAYSLSERAFDEYKGKVFEKLGAKREQAIRDEAAQDRVTRDPVENREVIISGTGEVLCYEAFTGRYFTSDVESLRKAQNDINHQINNDMYASLTDFYDKVGLPSTSVSDEIGWNGDRQLNLKFSTTLATDGRPCISIDFNVMPIRYFTDLE